jgi:uncharacterized membrane protein
MANQVTMGLFSSIEGAEEAINKLHDDNGIDTKDISVLYRNDKGQVKEVSGHKATESETASGAKTGATWGGIIGAAAGLAAATGVLPGIGTVLAAGPLVEAIGLTGAIGGTVSGALTGGVAGGLVGALSGWGLSKTDANKYSDRIKEGEVLVSVHGYEDRNIEDILSECGATDIRSFEMAGQEA